LATFLALFLQIQIACAAALIESSKEGSCRYVQLLAAAKREELRKPNPFLLKPTQKPNIIRLENINPFTQTDKTRKFEASTE
jgi:hypothetical protein